MINCKDWGRIIEQTEGRSSTIGTLFRNPIGEYYSDDVTADDLFRHSLNVLATFSFGTFNCKPKFDIFIGALVSKEGGLEGEGINFII